MNTINRACVYCGKAVRGRSDKKFCDDYCRNNHNNRLKADENNFVRNIIHALKKNRRILMEILPPEEEMVKTSRNTLVEHGFHFRYLTHTYTNKKGSTYYYCFEFGYLPLEQDRILIVKRKGER